METATLIKKRLNELEEEANELAEVSEDISEAKADIAIKGLVKLLAQMKTLFEESIESTNRTEHYDKELSPALLKTVSSIESLIASTKAPQVDVAVTPTINVDLMPIAKQINNNSEVLVKLLEKFATPNGEENVALRNLIVSMIKKQESFIERSLEKIDYTKVMEQISTTIKDRPRKWEFDGYKDANGRFKITATAK